MLGSYRLLVLIKLILFGALELMCTKDESFRRYHRPGVAPSSPSDSNLSPGTPFITVVAVSVDDYFAVVNCSTSVRVPHYRLDWYFKTSASLHSPRVIWQSGRSNTDRYTAYSPDQVRHYLQIKPVHQNDSGTYICLDQNTGSLHEVELIVRDSRSCAGCTIRLQMTVLVCLVLLSSILSRRTASESEVT